MIPQFPAMRGLRLSDQPEVVAITRQHLPYADFNFINLWSWNREERALVSRLHGNLVLRFADYITAEPFYMFLGNSCVDDTARQLVASAREERLGVRLRLIPECVAKELDQSAFGTQCDPGDNDYIVDVESSWACKGRKWHHQRTFVHRFEREHPLARFEVLDLTDCGIRSQVLSLFDHWAERKEAHAGEDAGYERQALDRCIHDFQTQIFAGGIYASDRLAAFVLTEDVGNTYALNHFEKADHWNFVGVVPFLDWRMAGTLCDRGVRYLNFEQDLGLEGLRRSKRARNPVTYLRKYEVVPRVCVSDNKCMSIAIAGSPAWST